MTDKEINKWLAENVMGWKLTSYAKGEWSFHNENNPQSDLTWQPTRNISQAMECLEKIIQEGCYFSLIYEPDRKGWEAMFTRKGTLHTGGANTPAMAICLAMHKALVSPYHFVPS